MSSKKDSSESGSLELLLDTMCNTFGGVMFIAISLVIIASFIPKIIKETTPEEITQEQLKKIEGEITEIKAKIETLTQNRSLNENIVEKYKKNPNLPLLVKYSNLKEKNANLANDEMQFRTTIQALELRLKLTKTENDKKQAELKEITDQIEQLTRTMKDEEEKLKIEIEIAKRDIATCKNKKKIVFSKMETTMKMPYFIIIGGNDVFPISDRQHESLLETDINSGKKSFYVSDNVSSAFIESQGKVIFTPKNGICKGDASDFIFETLLKGIHKNKRFISAMVKDDSFPLFIKLRDFARDKGFEIYWYPVVDNSEYFLILTNKVDYEAQ